MDLVDAWLFECRTDTDCGDDGAVCAIPPGNDAGSCCFPSPEVCDGEDNDCNGLADDGVPPAICYDGPEGTANVGICRVGQQFCVGGQMVAECVGQIVPRRETCNGSDDDCDGETEDVDCEDKDCDGQSCGVGCVCADRDKTEINCEDAIDNDGDDEVDCEDVDDCLERPCGDGPAGTRTCHSNGQCR